MEPSDESGCVACDLLSGRRTLPGGEIYRTTRWAVEHALGPLEEGTLVVKPTRHVCHVADLNADESAELGPLLRLAARVVTQLCDPDQVYVCLWSHAGFRPVHLHFVIEPVALASVVEVGLTGAGYQAHLFETDARRPSDAVSAFCELARRAFGEADRTGL